MERVVFVEVLGRRGEVHQRVRLAQLPATIGRAWSNDVILADPLVDAQHARLVQDESGVLALEDLGSVNGIFGDGHAKPEPRVVVTGQGLVRLGRTRLRIATADQPVPPAVRDAEAATGPLANLLASPRAMIAVVAAELVVTSIGLWLSDYESSAAEALGGGALVLALGIATWAGIWAFAGRMIVHQARFWQHVVVACLFFLAVELVSVAGSWAAFFLDPPVLADHFALVVVALAAGALTVHAGLASAAPLKRRLLFSIALVAGFGLLAWFGEKSSRDDWGSHVAIGATLKPLPAGMIPARSMDSFVDVIGRVQRTIDRKDDDEKKGGK